FSNILETRLFLSCLILTFQRRKVQSYRVVVGKRNVFRVLQIPDCLRLAFYFDSLSGKPVESARNPSADAPRRPEDKRKTPFGNPIAQICIFFDASDVVMKRPDARFI